MFRFAVLPLDDYSITWRVVKQETEKDSWNGVDRMSETGSPTGEILLLREMSK